MTGRRVALHIGLDGIEGDERRRDGVYLGALYGTVDANRFATRTRDAGFDEVTVLLDADASVARVKAELAKAASSLAAGDLLVVTYAGHGMQVPDESGDEDDGADETWELWDDRLPDDDIGALLKTVPEGVSVVLLSDSCHSQSVFTAFPVDAGPDAPTLSDEVPAAPGVVPTPLGQVFRSRFVALSACPDEGVALDFGWGLLTAAVLTVWDQHPDATWGELIDQACARLRNVEAKQNPKVAASAAGMALFDRPAFAG